MHLISALENIPEETRGAVVAIGNFDGVHRGHQGLLSLAKEKADDKNLPFVVLTFEPHPRSILRPDDPPFRITPGPLKLQILEQNAPDYIVALPFDWDFASQAPEEFVQEILVKSLDAAHVFIGRNFRFGQLRKGSPEIMREHMDSVTDIDPFTDDRGEVYSSSRVRACLRHGEIDEANALLGWNWEIQGKVVHGDRRGRKLGYPTANVPLGETIHPGYGVYAALVKIIEDGEDAPWMMAAANIGIRPMFEMKTGQAEAYIFDFDREIYGINLRIKPLKWIRGEAKFSTVDELVGQMGRDCDEIRNLLSRGEE
jgi:riboflavin kinase/FMN adenylyltransferase